MEVFEAAALLGEAGAEQVTVDGGHGAPRKVVWSCGDVTGSLQSPVQPANV